METLLRLKHRLEKEIDDLLEKNDISPTELERLGIAADIIKDIVTTCAMEDYPVEKSYDTGYSGRMPYYARDVRPSNMWDSGASYGRPRMGGMYAPDIERGYMRSYGMPYSNGYSGHATREDLRMDLREMMNNAKNDKERLAIQQFLDSWKDV